MLEYWGDQGGLPGLGHLPCGEGSIVNADKISEDEQDLNLLCERTSL